MTQHLTDARDVEFVLWEQLELAQDIQKTNWQINTS